MPMLHHCWFALLYGVMSVCEPVMGAPNIVMITVEDLGWSDVSWNNPEVIMPNIATLASSGVILGRVIGTIMHMIFLFIQF